MFISLSSRHTEQIKNPLYAYTLREPKMISKWIYANAKKVLAKKNLSKLTYHGVNTLNVKQAYVAKAPTRTHWANGNYSVLVVDNDVKVHVVLTKECCKFFESEHEGDEIETVSQGMAVEFHNLQLRVYRRPNSSSLEICYIAEKLRITVRMQSDVAESDYKHCGDDGGVLRRVCNGPNVDWIHSRLCFDTRAPPTANDCSKEEENAVQEQEEQHAKLSKRRSGFRF